LSKSTGYQFRVATSTATDTVRGAILITTANAIPGLSEEGYELTVAPDSVVIRAPTQAGAFYGVQSLLQLLPPQIYSPRIVPGVAWSAPCVYIQDRPSFSWRGVMFDPARHFINKDEIKQALDAMAVHKLNTFHWHLVDDQSWCLEITNFPNLTAIAAFRKGIDYGLPPRSSSATNSAGQYGGFYTQADAREIVAYAAERHITVVPEIEMPCHSTPGLTAYPQFGCGNNVASYNQDYPYINYSIDLYSLGTPGTMAFLQQVLTEVMQIFPSKYIHCGGDEVVASGDTQWNTYNADVTNMMAHGITPNGTASIVAYQHWFSTNMASFVQSKGRTMMCWTEFENGGVVTNAALMDWIAGSQSQAVNAATNGQQVVMSPNAKCYINYMQGTNVNFEPPFIVGGAPAFCSLSNIYTFNPIPTNLPAAFRTNILGGQCNLWGEYVPSFRNVMFKLFPRASALAEVTWTPTNSQSFSSFTNRLAIHEQRFDAMGVNYNRETIPQIGAWGPTVSTSPVTMNWDITTNVTAAGEIDVNFVWTSGNNGLLISSATLLQNGTPVDTDNHVGVAGKSPAYTLYIFRLPATKPGATYTIQAVVSGYNGSSSSGVVYLPDWN
jgi:hexosaminidase